MPAPITAREAAQARAQNVRSLADRPQQRRNAEDAQRNGRPRVRAQLKDVQIRLADPDTGALAFHGCASTTETGYEMWDFFGPYTEVVAAGAFAQTLLTPDLDVPLVLQHDSLRRIARTTNGSLQLVEDDEGLQVDAPNLDPADADVAYIVPKLRSGLVDEMSFMFTITAGQWSPDYMEFRISSVDIHRGDVAIVGYGANPTTSAELRDQSLDQLLGAVDLGEARRCQDLLDRRIRELAPRPTMTRAEALSLP